MPDKQAKTNGAPTARNTWEEWAERTSLEQIRILCENNQKRALRARRKQNLMRMCRFTFPALAAVLIIFFCFVPTGRALAQAALDNITRSVGHFFYLQSADDGSSPADNEATAVPGVPGGFEKIKTAARQAQEPLLYFANSGLLVSDVSVAVDDATTTVKIEYKTSRNDSISTNQVITKNQAGWGVTMDADGKAPFTYTLYNGETLYCTYTREGHAFGSARWGNTFFSISSLTLKWEMLQDSVDALACVQ